MEFVAKPPSENLKSAEPVQALKEALCRLLRLFGAPALCRYLNRRKALILMYHAVVPDNRPYRLWTHVKVNEFRQQIRFLKNNYRVLSLSEVTRRVASGSALPDNVAVVTFDDGFLNNYVHAYPILKQEQVPATIFLATGFVDSQEFNWPDRLYLLLLGTLCKRLDLSSFGFGVFELQDEEQSMYAYSALLAVLKSSAVESKNRLLAEIERQLGPLESLGKSYAEDFAPMSWEQASEMQASGLIEFGAHTVNHEILSRLNKEQMSEEIRTSCDRVAEKLGVASPAFAYPNGQLADFDENARQMLEDMQLPCALTTVNKLCATESDHYKWPRIGVGADMSLGRFEIAASGLP